MKSRSWIAGAVLFMAFFTSASTQAELVIGAGVLNPLHDEEGKQWMGVLEYRFPEMKWNVRPWIGVAHAERGTTFTSVGLLYTFTLRKRLRFSAGWAPTYYDACNGRKLGSDLDFYSFAEGGYVFKNNHAMSVRFGHLSNGGFANSNPGTETLQLAYSLPFPP